MTDSAFDQRGALVSLVSLFSLCSVLLISEDCFEAAVEIRLKMLGIGWRVVTQQKGIVQQGIGGRVKNQQ